MNTERIDGVVTTGPPGVDGAVGVAEANWYVAIVNSRHEKSVADKLGNLGYIAYVATQKELHVWKNGRRKMVDRVVIPSVVFVKCSEASRRVLVSFPFIQRFMVNRSATSCNLGKPVAIIPDNQIARLRFMLGQSDVPVSMTDEYRRGDKVRVIRGSLRGLEGEIVTNSDESSVLVVLLEVLGCAKVHINPADVERV